MEGVAGRLMDNSWKKNIMRSFRLSPAFLEQIQTDRETRKLSLSEYVRQAMTMYVKQGQIERALAQKPPEEPRQWSPELYARLERRR